MRTPPSDMICWPVFEAMPIPTPAWLTPWMPESNGSRLCCRSMILTFGFGSGPLTMFSLLRLLWLAMLWFSLIVEGTPEVVCYWMLLRDFFALCPRGLAPELVWFRSIMIFPLPCSFVGCEDVNP